LPLGSVGVVSHITSAYTYRKGVVTPTDPKSKEGEILLSRALGGLRDKGRHGQKTKKFLEIFFKISIINISASKPNILKTLKWFEETHHFKPIGLFLGAAVDEKTAAQKTKKKSKFRLLPLSFFKKSPKLQKLGDFGFQQST
jgi:hypothetical protein